jgi:P27 family predicted phage terminase small subunit
VPTRRKPIEQARREGNPGKRRLPDPLKVKGVPQPPDDLPAAGKELWAELVEALARWHLLDQVDRAALTAVCTQWARAEAARQVIRRKGMFSTGSTGQIVEHPAVGIERAAHAMLVRFLGEFGGTAVARTRIASALSDGAEAPFADIGPSPRLRAVQGGRK